MSNLATEWIRKRRSALQMAGLALVVFMILSSVSERVPEGGGTGWDGRYYSLIAKHFDEVLAKGVHPLYARRWLPSALCHYTLRALGVPLHRGYIIRFFLCMNILLVSAVAWLWGLVADRLKLSTPAMWTGFAALVVNYAVLKRAPYCPVATDMSALALGMLMLHFYLAARPLLLVAVTLLGAVTWPTLLPQGFVLLLFPRAECAGRPGRAANVLVGVVVVGFILFALKQGISHYGFHTMEDYYFPRVTSINAAFPLSVFLVCAAALAFTYYLFPSDRLFSWKRWRSHVRPSRVVLALATLVVGHYLSKTMEGTFLTEMGGDGGSAWRYIQTALRMSVARPAEFFVAHVVYLGPLFLLAPWLLPRLSPVVRELGFGVVVLLFAVFIQILSPISRQMMGAYPFFVTALILGLDRKGITPRFAVGAIILSLAMSRVWFLINGLPGAGDVAEEVFWANYTIAAGKYMSMTAYYVQGVACVFGVCLVPMFLRQRLPDEHAKAPLSDA